MIFNRQNKINKLLINRIELLLSLYNTSGYKQTNEIKEQIKQIDILLTNLKF